jgi:hypothetical protein
VLAEHFLKMSQILCLLNEPELLKEYLHTFYTQLVNDESEDQRIRKFNILKQFCKKMNVSNSMVEAIDQVILERNYHQDILDWECLEKQVPK